MRAIGCKSSVKIKYKALLASVRIIKLINFESSTRLRSIKIVGAFFSSEIAHTSCGEIKLKN